MVTRIADGIGVNKVVLALSTARLADALGNSILFIIIPLYVAQLPSPAFALPDSALVGILVSMYGLIAAIFQPVMGVFADRMHRHKPFIQLGLVIMALGTLAFVFAHRFSDLLVIRSIQGLGIALTIPASMALMATVTVKRTRGGSMGVYSTMRMLGFAIGPLIGGFLHVQFGFNAAFYAGSALVFASAILVQFWVHEDRTAAPEKVLPSVKFFDPDIWTSSIIGLGSATFLMAASFSMMIPLENEFNARLQQTALGFGIAFSALTFSRLLVQVPLGRLSDRIGRKPLIMGGMVLMAPATMLLGMVNTTLQLTGVRAFQGLASAAIAAPAFALAADLTRGGGEGRQMSLLTAGFGLGIAVGPLIAGFLAVIFFELPFLIGGLLSLAGVWIIYRYVPETVHRQQKAQTAYQKR